MLVTCPECGKQISDKSKQCVHCGFPLDFKEPTSYNIIYRGFPDNETQFKNQVRLIACLRNFNKDISLSEAKKIIDNPPQVIFENISQDNIKWMKETIDQFGCLVDIEDNHKYEESDINDKISPLAANGGNILCPRCASNQITTGQRGFSFLTGFFGLNKTVNRCAKCGHVWEPK